MDHVRSSIFLYDASRSNFLNSIVKTGYKRALKQKDLGGFNPKDDPELLYNTFDSRYKLQEDLPREKRSLFGPILKATGVWRWYGLSLLNPYLRRVLAIICSLLVYSTAFVPTLVMEALVSDLQSNNPEDKLRTCFSSRGHLLATSTKWILALVIWLVPSLGSFLHNYASMTLSKIGTPFCPL